MLHNCAGSTLASRRYRNRSHSAGSSVVSALPIPGFTLAMFAVARLPLNPGQKPGAATKLDLLYAQGILNDQFTRPGSKPRTHVSRI